MIRSQPSIATNIIILNGKETMVGESIIIPRARSIFATIKSITRNGIKTRKPI